MEEAIAQFLEITKIESRDVAEYYLSVSDGDVQAAIGMVFEDGGGSKAGSKETEVEIVDSDPEACIIVDDVNPEIKILEWNIQGLLDDCLQQRMVAVVGIIKSRKPAVVMLQEVIPEIYSYLKSALKPNYVGFSPIEMSIPCGHYFTAIFVDKVIFKSPVGRSVSFPNSRQGRQILVVEGRCHGKDVAVMTSHLESTKPSESERKAQLGTLYSVMMQIPQSRTVIFGGDTNLRDAEFNSVVRSGMFDTQRVNDIWTMLGSPQDARFSWDLQKNDNQIKGGNARLRFERMFMRVEDASSKDHFKPREMKFVGVDRLQCGLFPSDHWGILTLFSL